MSLEIGEAGSGEAGSGEAGSGEAAPVEIGAGEIGPVEIGPGDDATARARRRIGLAVVFLLAIAVMRRPTPSSVVDDFPANLGDPALVTWIMSWNVHALLSSPFDLFEANNYFPFPRTLAYADPMTPMALVFAVFSLVTGSWTVSLNLTLYGLVLVSLVGTYLLARRLSGRTDAAVVAAFAFTFSGYALSHWGHPQLWNLGFIALGILVLLRVLDERTVPLGILLGVLTAVISLSAAYHGVAFIVAMVTIIAVDALWRRRTLDLAYVKALAAGGLVTAVLVIPFTLPYLRLQDEPGFARDAPATWGLDLVDFLTPAPGTWFMESFEGIGPPRDAEHRFFLGVTTYALAAAGVVGLVATRRRRPITTPPHDERPDGEPRRGEPGEPDRRRREVLLLGAAAAVCSVLALGVEVRGRTAPFAFFHDHVPGFGGIRVAARLAVITLLFIAVLAAYGLAWLVRRARRWVGPALAAGALVLLGFELQADAHSVRLTTDAATLAVYHELDDRPDGAVVELPMMVPSNDPPAWAFVESTRHIYSTIDWNERVNGYSGYTPPPYETWARIFNTWPSAEALDLAREIGVRYVVLHGGAHAHYAMFSEKELDDRIAATPAELVAGRYGNSWLIDLGPVDQGPDDRRRVPGG